MEHNYIILLKEAGIEEKNKIDILLSYAELIYHENLKYNLTGHKTITEIIQNLISGSLKPVIELNVPRGTFFADLGSGSGIPGIPLAVKYPDVSGVLFDSNRKKTDFIEKAKNVLGINNITTVCMRVEEAGRTPEFRERFDLVVTRAMSDIYTIAELGSPLLKKNGYIYIYTNQTAEEIGPYISEHINRLGLVLIKNMDVELNFPIRHREGIIIKKIHTTENIYPRRMAVIKRMAAKK